MKLRVIAWFSRLGVRVPALLLALSIAFAETPVIAEECPDSAVRIYLDASGVVTVNGSAVSLADLQQTLTSLKPTPTEVCYARENPNGDPPPQVTAVMDAIMGLRLPIGLYTDSTFKTRAKLK